MLAARQLTVSASQVRDALVSAWLLAAALVVGACSAPLPNATETPAKTVEAEQVPNAETTPLQPYQLLEVTVVPFSLSTASQKPVSTMESRLFAWQLREVLAESARWGAVRMLPESDEISELAISGRIITADGQRVALWVRVVDSTGRVWLEREYAHVASAEDYPDERVAYRDPFRSIYYRIARDLDRLRASFDQRSLQRIQETAQVKYAAHIAPAAFSEYVTETDSGWQLNRLPADGDPIMDRVLRVRDAELLFVDTVDQSYSAFYRQVYPAYSQWRRLSFEERVALQQLQTSGPSDRRGFGGMRDNYRDYREIQLAEASLRDLLRSIRFEAAPTVVELEDRQRTLEGSIEQQYEQWRSLLDGIYRSELGL